MTEGTVEKLEECKQPLAEKASDADRKTDNLCSRAGRLGKGLERGKDFVLRSILTSSAAPRVEQDTERKVPLLPPLLPPPSLLVPKPVFIVFSPPSPSPPPHTHTPHRHPRQICRVPSR